MTTYTDAEKELWRELRDFAEKASGERKTRIASCLIWPDGRKVFGTNRLRDDHGLSDQEIAERIRPKFYNAIKHSEPDAIDRARDLGLDLDKAKLYSLLLPCPACAEIIAKTKITTVIALTHRTKQNGLFDNPLEDSQKTFDEADIQYGIGEPDGQ